MTSTNDLDLLGEFIREHSQDAFTALVHRHLNLVYCAALRQVRSPQLAEEIAQSVFMDLARDAARLKPDTILAAWLYKVTRRTAIDVVRRETRRQSRDKIALEMNLLNTDADDWAQIEPLLDEAMAALEDTDRSALLLRYFEEKSLREVGEALGTTDDTARKRVNHAIEKLREFFANHGVAVSAGGLLAVISTNAIQAAPIGLAATISTTVMLGAAAMGATAATTIKTFNMTMLQKVTISAAIAASIGTAIYEADQLSRLKSDVRVLHQQQTSFNREVAQLKSERDEAVRQRTVSDLASKRSAVDTAELLRLRGEVGLLRRSIAAANPVQQPTTNRVQFTLPYLPREEWSDKGTDKPLNTILTMFSAIGRGDESKLEQIVSRSKSSQTVEDLTIPKRDWDKLSGVQIVKANWMKDVSEGKVEEIASVEAIVEKASIDPASTNKDVDVHRWQLMKTNDQWLITFGM